MGSPGHLSQGPSALRRGALRPLSRLCAAHRCSVFLGKGTQLSHQLPAVSYPPALPQAAARLGPQDSSAVDVAPPLPLQITFEISKQEDSQIPIWIIVGSTLGGLLLLALLVLALWKVRAPQRGWGSTLAVPAWGPSL